MDSISPTCYIVYGGVSKVVVLRFVTPVDVKPVNLQCVE